MGDGCSGFMTAYSCNTVYSKPSCTWGFSWFSLHVCSGLWRILDVDDAQVHRQHLQMCLRDVASDGLEALRWVLRHASVAFPSHCSVHVSVRFGPVEFVPVCNCTRPSAAATGWRRRPGSPWDDTCAVFLCWELVSWAPWMFVYLDVLRLHLLSSTQRRRSLSDTSACLYGMTADTRCVYFLPHLISERCLLLHQTLPQLSSCTNPPLLSKSEAAMCSPLSFQRSTGFCHSFLFGSIGASDHRLQDFRPGDAELSKLSRPLRAHCQQPNICKSFATIWALNSHSADWIWWLFPHNFHKKLHCKHQETK